MLNLGKGKEESKDIADAAIKPGHQRTGPGKKPPRARKKN